MASESKPMDIEEEVPEIEDEIKKPEDEGRVPAAEREWEYQREPEAQNLEAPDIFATYRKETLPIFETRRKWNPFKRGKKGKKIGNITWEDDVKTIADNIKEQKEAEKHPEFSVGEKHRMDHPDTKEYSFYKSMLEFHDKISADPQSEEEPIGAQPTGRGRRVGAAPFKRPRGKPVGQRTSLVSGKKVPFKKKQPKGTVGRGAKRRQKPTESPSAGATGAMAGLASEYEPKYGKRQVSPVGGKVKVPVGFKKKPVKSPAPSASSRTEAQQQALKLPTGRGDLAAGGGALKPKEEARKIPRPKKESKRKERKEAERIHARAGAKETGTYSLSGEDYRKQQAAEAAAKRKKIKRPSSGSGAPKIAAIKAWYSEVYGI